MEYSSYGKNDSVLAWKMGHLSGTSPCSKKMKNKLRTILIVTITVFAVLVGLFFLLPKTNCCDESDLQLEELTNRAVAGQLDAITMLYERAKREGVEPSEEYWALEGALRGDQRLRRAYVEMFKTRADSERQQRLLRIIKERSAMPGAPCLLESLGAPLSTASACK